jgi:CRP-like cAMP-binding protein
MPRTALKREHTVDPCDALFRRHRRFARLSELDRKLLADAACERLRHFGPREDIAREGDRPTGILLMVEGWACRYKSLEDGRRQIVGFFLPGDFCDLNVFVLNEMDHSLGTITSATVGEIGREWFERLQSSPRIAELLWRDALVTAAIQREWIVSLGQRHALERTGHLLCETFLRLDAAGLASGSSCEFPITQAELADATGLSAVHVNRTLQELRSTGLVSLANRTLTIHDMAALMRASLFNPSYLHLRREATDRSEPPEVG